MSSIDGTGASMDLTGEAWILSEGMYAQAPKGATNIPRMAERVKRLIICRESSEFDRVMMDGMVQQTLALMDASASKATAVELRLLPLTEPEGALPGLTRSFVRYGKAKAVLFEINGDFFLYSMSSAAKMNKEGENEWTSLCTQVIERLRPVEIIVSSLSRLVRTFEHSGTILSAVSKHVDLVHAGSASLTMRGAGAEVGQMMWSMLAMIAASERNLIVQRLTAGIVAKYNRGEWIKGSHALPLGYAFDPITKNLVVDPNTLAGLKLAWTLMADPNVTTWQVVQRLGDFGVTTPRMKYAYGEDATVADQRNPDSYLRALRGWSHLYLTGEHVTHWPSPFEGAVHIAGMPVHRSTEGPGELRFIYRWGKPDIDPALIQAGMTALKIREKSPITGGAARSQIAPLNGYRWRQGPMEFWLSSATDTQYQLRARGCEEVGPRL